MQTSPLHPFTPSPLKRFCSVLALFLWVAIFEGAQAQLPYPNLLKRIEYCTPFAPYTPGDSDPTLCDQFSEIDENSADVLIGSSSSSVTLASSLSSSILSDKTVYIRGKFVVDEYTWFTRCTVRMGTGAEIEVADGIRFLAFLSKFFACDYMWKGITLKQTARGEIWHCEIEDADAALRTTTGNYISVVGTRFNRNYRGVYSLNTAGFGFVLPTTFNPVYFTNNTFTATSELNLPYPGQVLNSNFATVGVHFVSTAGNLTSSVASAPNRFERLDCGIWIDFRSSATIGSAECTGNSYGVYTSIQSRANLPAAFPSRFVGNTAAGIFVLIASGLDVDGAYFEGNTIGIANDAQSNGVWGITIRNSRFQVQSGNIIAILLQRPDNRDLIVENNYIEIENPSGGNGIFVEQRDAGATINNTCLISRDTVIIRDQQDDSANNYAIQVDGGSGNNISILDNYVFFDAERSEMRGIVLNNFDGVNHLISGNQVAAVAYVKESAARSGFDIRGVKNAVFCNNTVDNTIYGARFFGDCNPIEIEANSFGKHFWGLYARPDQFSGEPPILGTQFRNANTWTPGPGGYDGWGALLTQGDAFASQFIIHSFSPVYSTSVNPGNWFFVNFGSPEVSCEIESFTDPDSSEIQIADGSFFTDSTSDLLRWELERSLMYKLYRDTGYGSAITAFDSFYNASLNTTAGLFARVAWELHQVGAWSGALVGLMDSLEQKHNDHVNQLVQLTGTLAPPDSTALIDSVYAASQQNILKDLLLVEAAMDSLAHAPDSLRRVALLNIRVFNSNIATTHAFEENQQLLYELAIKEALGDSLTAADLTALEDITLQPDSVAGSTKLRAASLLSACEHLLVLERAQEPQPFANAVPDPRADPFWRLSPNPVKHVAQVVFQAPFTGTVVVTDQIGRAVWQNNLRAASVLTLPVHDLSPGMYFLSASGEHSGARMLKMIVVR